MQGGTARWGIDGLGFGIALGGVANPKEWQRTLGWVDFAEQRQVHSIWVPEMHFVPGACSTPLVNLAAIAARTQRLRLATTSLLLPLAHPTTIARDIATLDHLCGGRLILGLGRGFPKHLFNAFEIEPSSKRDRFDDCLELVMKLWRGEKIDPEHSPFHDFEKVGKTHHMPTLQQPHPPLAVAAFGRKGLAQAARWGLPYLASPMEPFDLIAENLAFHASELATARSNQGTRFADRTETADPADCAVVPIMRTLFVSEDPAVRKRVMGRLAAARRPAQLKLPKAIARAAEAPIEARVVVGTRSEVVAALARYRETLGMNLLIASPMVPGATVDEQQASLSCLVDEVVPALR